MIDSEGFRPNVGIVLCNAEGHVLWARRLGGQDAWQFPQGGIKKDEDAETALFRELKEEIGLTESDVSILGVTRGWLRYRLPARYIRQQDPVCVGQKQKWFLLELTSDENRICLSNDGSPEFDDWRWVSYWYPMNQVVAFKRDVYRRALKELAPIHTRFEEAKSSNPLRDTRVSTEKIVRSNS